LLVTVVVDREVSQLPGKHGQTALHGRNVQQGNINSAGLVLLTDRSTPVQGLNDLASQRGRPISISSIDIIDLILTIYRSNRTQW